MHLRQSYVHQLLLARNDRLMNGARTPFPGLTVTPHVTAPPPALPHSPLLPYRVPTSSTLGGHMRVRATAVTAALLLTALTACGGDGDGKAEKKPSAAKESTKKIDCSDQYVSQKEWLDHCDGKEGVGTGGDGTEGEAADLKLGAPAETIGDGGTGVLQITPDTVVYVKKSGTETAKNGTFAVVTMKDKAMTGAPADEVAPISGGGWSWIATDGESIGFDSGNASSIVIDKYNNADPVQPGTYQWRLQAFDLTPAQAKGGTLTYVDGEETAYRWKIPATDSGPNVAELKKQLAE